MDKCAKCGVEGFLWGSMDLLNAVCPPCLELFDAWADAHPRTPFAEFLTPEEHV